jgi:hypothetical protein
LDPLGSSTDTTGVIKLYPLGSIVTSQVTQDNVIKLGDKLKSICSDWNTIMYYSNVIILYVHISGRIVAGSVQSSLTLTCKYVGKMQ